MKGGIELGAIVIYGCGPQDTEKLTPIGELNVKSGARLFHQLSDQEVRIIPTGGRTGKSSFSEAEIMGKRLNQFEIPNERMVLETKATNTIENVVFVTNIVDRIGFNRLIHVTPKHHLPRTRELCFLVGIDHISQYRSAQEILGVDHPLVEEAEEVLKVGTAAESRWMQGLREIPLYWLPQMAQVASIQRFRHVLGHGRIQGWLEENFSVFNVDYLTDKEIGDIKEKVQEIERVMP